MLLSVICPVLNEEKYIEKCIQSVVDSDFPKEEMELLLIDGGSSDKTLQIIDQYCQKYSWIRVLANPKRIVPCALNLGIRAAQGKYIIRIDAHADYPENYLSVLTGWHEKLDADNIGTVCRTDVLNKNSKTLAIREVLCNKFGVGNSAFRVGIKDLQEADTVPFGCWKAGVFKKYGLFNENLVRNQDIEFNKRMLRNGGRIFLVPDSYCTYYARETWKAIAKNNFQNGVWNILTVFYTGNFNSISLRHMIPLCFVLSLIVPLFLAVVLMFFTKWWSCFLLIPVCSLTAYLFLISAVSCSLSKKKKLNFFKLIVTFMVLHLAYGLGTFYGLFKSFFRDN